MSRWVRGANALEMGAAARCVGVGAASALRVIVLILSACLFAPRSHVLRDLECGCKNKTAIIRNNGDFIEFHFEK